MSKLNLENYELDDDGGQLTITEKSTGETVTIDGDSVDIAKLAADLDAGNQSITNLKSLSTDQEVINWDSPSESEIKSALDNQSSGEALVTSGAVTWSSVHALNTGGVTWIHYGDINLDSGADFIAVGDDDSVPANGTVHIHGNVTGASDYTTNNGETAVLMRTWKRWNIKINHVENVQRVFDLAPDTNKTGLNLYESAELYVNAVHRVYDHLYRVGPEPTDVSIEGNVVYCNSGASTGLTPILFEDGAFNGFIGDIHGGRNDSTAPSIDSVQTRGKNQFITKFERGEPRLHYTDSYESAVYGSKPSRGVFEGSNVSLRTNFETIDGYWTSTSGSGSVGQNNLSLELSTGTTSGSGARAWGLIPAATVPKRDWQFARCAGFGVDFKDTQGPIYLGTGKVALSDKTHEHIGVAMKNGDLIGTVGDGSAETTTTLISGAASGGRRIWFSYHPSKGVDYWVDGTHQGSITSGLPSGQAESHIILHATAENSTTTDRTVTIGRAEIGQRSI